MAKYQNKTTGVVEEISSPELNPELTAGKSLVSDNTSIGGQAGFQSITSESLTPTKTVNYNTPQVIPIYPVSGLNTTTNPSQLTNEEIKASNLSSDIQKLNLTSVGKAGEQAKQEEIFGIPELTKSQKDLEVRLKGLQNEALAIPLQLQQESQGRGVTAGGIQPIQTARLRENAIRALTVSSLLEASRGNIATAQDQADRAVAQKYDPIEEEIRVKTANLDLILKDPKTTLAQKNRAGAQLQIQEARKAELEKNKQNDSIVLSLMTEAIKNSPDNAFKIQQVQGRSPQEALSILAPYLSDPLAKEKALTELELNRANIDRIRADTAKTNAEKEKIISEFPTSKNGKKQLQNNEALTLVNELLSPDSIGKGSALGFSGAKFVPFGQSLGLQGERTSFEAKVNTLKSNLTLDNLSLLKGAMSDKDLLFLNSIGSSLDTSMSEAEFDKELTRIKDKLENAGATAITSSSSIPRGTDGASYGLPDYESDGTQWVLKNK